jgi:hypothetical protein
MSESIRDFLFMAFISVFLWLIFELFNLRLKNWSYFDLPQARAERWMGYCLAYATVIPALMEISYFFQTLLKNCEKGIFQLKITTPLLRLFIFLGLISFLLPLFFPRIFFPLVWLCFIFLIEPLNYKIKNSTFLRDLSHKNWTPLWSWISAGFTAGILWEFLNSWAGSHWEYSLPYFNFGRVFQMPIMGYLGFLPFALEVFVLYQFLFSLWKFIKDKKILKGIVLTFLLAFYIWVFSLIDKFSLN